MSQTYVKKVHGAVVLTGSSAKLGAVRAELQESFVCHHYRDNALLVADVAVDELPQLTRFAEAHGCRVEDVRNTREVRIAAEEPVKQPKQPKLDLAAGGWYKTNQEAFPLIHVVEIRNEVDQDGVQLWLFDVDLVSADHMPQQATMSAEQLKGLKPKPATLDDFEDLDIAPPAGFEQADPHVIPSTDEDTKTAGVSLAQAQLAAQQLQRDLGVQYCRTKVVQGSTGFLVQARLFGRPTMYLPDEIGGTPVRYS